MTTFTIGDLRRCYRLSTDPRPQGPRVMRAEVDAWSRQPTITLTLTGMTELPAERIRLESPIDYPVPLPHDMQSGQFEQALSVMLSMAHDHPWRRHLPALVDEALALALRPNGPATQAVLTQHGGITTLRISPRIALAASVLGLPEWIHVSRTIESWQRRCGGRATDIGALEVEVTEAISAANGHQRQALNTVLAEKALAAFNAMLRLPPED